MTANTSRLWEMARKRKAFMNSGNPKSIYWTERCIQCGDAATAKHTDLRFGEPQISYWCDTDWDLWWMAKTVRELMQTGQISHISQAIVPPITEENSMFADQLMGWPE